MARHNPDQWPFNPLWQGGSGLSIEEEVERDILEAMGRLPASPDKKYFKGQELETQYGISKWPTTPGVPTLGERLEGARTNKDYDEIVREIQKTGDQVGRAREEKQRFDEQGLSYQPTISERLGLPDIFAPSVETPTPPSPTALQPSVQPKPQPTLPDPSLWFPQMQTPAPPQEPQPWTPPPIGSVGTPTGQKTTEGREMYQFETTPGQEPRPSSEISITVELPDGRWANLPSLHNGAVLSEADSLFVVEQAGWTDPETGNPIEFFNSQDEAVAAAQVRSPGIQPEDPPGMVLPDPMHDGPGGLETPPPVRDLPTPESLAIAAPLDTKKGQPLVIPEHLQHLIEPEEYPKEGFQNETQALFEQVGLSPEASAEVYRTQVEPFAELGKSLLYRGSVKALDEVDKQLDRFFSLTGQRFPILKDIADLARSRTQGEPDNPTLATKVLSGIGEFLTGDLPILLGFTKGLGMVPGFAALGAVQGSEFGAEEAVKQGLVNALFGGELKALQVLKMGQRASGGGAVFGAQAAAADPDITLDELLVEVGSGAIFLGPGSIGGMRVRDAIRVPKLPPKARNIFESMNLDPETVTMAEAAQAFKARAVELDRAASQATAGTEAQRQAIIEEAMNLRNDYKEIQNILKPAKTAPVPTEVLAPEGKMLPAPEGFEPPRVEPAPPPPIRPEPIKVPFEAETVPKPPGDISPAPPIGEKTPFVSTPAETKPPGEISPAPIDVPAPVVEAPPPFKAPEPEPTPVPRPTAPTTLPVPEEQAEVPAIVRPSESIQQDIDRLEEGPTVEEAIAEIDKPGTSLNKLYEEREKAYKTEAKEFVDAILKDLNMGDEGKRAVRALGFYPANRPTFIQDRINRWGVSTEQTIEDIYNELQPRQKSGEDQPFVKFHWGGTADNPVLQAEVEGGGKVDPETIRKTELVYNAIAKQIGEGPINLSKSLGTKQPATLPTPEEATVKPPADVPVPGEQVEAAESTKVGPSMELAKWVGERLGSGEGFQNKELYGKADGVFQGTEAQGIYTPKDANDAMELGVNQFIAENPRRFDVTGRYDVMGAGLEREQGAAKRSLTDIKENILDKLPTQQQRRTAEMDEFQQFSTPPDLAYLMNWVANVTGKDVYLEPSAGLGGIAVFGKNAGAQVIVNEFSPRRVELLKQMGFDQVLNENAEQLHNILPKDIRPTVIVMNPPFSSTAGRKQGERKSSNVVAHLDQALKRLQPGGRLVALIGAGRVSMQRKDEAGQREEVQHVRAVADWIRKVSLENHVAADVLMNGKNFKKYGVTWNNRILVIDKVAPNPDRVTVDQQANPDGIFPPEGVDLLKEVRDARQRPAEGTQQGQRPPAQPGGPPVAPSDRPGPGGGRPVSLPTDVVGPGPGDQLPAPGPRGDVPVASGGVSRPGRRGGRADVSGGRPTGTPDRGGTTPGRPDTEGRGEVPDRQPGREDAERPGPIRDLPPTEGTVEQPEPPTVPPQSQETAPKTTQEEEPEGSIYEQYQPPDLGISGMSPHPGPLVQSTAMSSVQPPKATYKITIVDQLKKVISGAQLEAVVYAYQAFEQKLASGFRRGFFIGDGTGVGKGREVAAIIREAMARGLGGKKAVWVTANDKLLKDSKRDVTNTGGDASTLVQQGKIKKAFPITGTQGVLFTTYDMLASGLQSDRHGHLTETLKNDAQGNPIPGTEASRLTQLINWLGADFDGVIAFDEAHKMANSMGDIGPRGRQAPATRALAGIDLQRRLPNARILYVSATGATEVRNLAYAERLGLWGEGTAFSDKSDFISKISAGGIGAMEVVARDMKALGLYTARSLSYRGVTTDTLVHELTEQQEKDYDIMARAWQSVLGEVEHALVSQGASTQTRSNALAQFWAAELRFYNQVLTSIQMPSVLADMRKELAEGHAIILQLVNTNEAILTRQVQSAQQEEGDLENLDLTPRQNLMDYIEKLFPVQEYEAFTDENGVQGTRPVRDAQGNPVLNADAVAAKERLLDEMGALKAVPEGPLEQLMNAFGTDAVTEVTGRKMRVIRKMVKGKMTTVVEPRTPTMVQADIRDFNNDKKQILVFSGAGATGETYSSDLTYKNQRRRIHYPVQMGWRADEVTQGFGRSHRANQRIPPHFRNVTTNLKGHKRFSSSIARRLDQLGALTKGHRGTAGGGLLSSADNLENPYAPGAIRSFFNDLHLGRIQGLNFSEVTRGMGLENLVDRDGRLLEARFPKIQKFLNRILPLEIKLQNKVFDEWHGYMTRAIDRAAELGILDMGMETLKADIVTKQKETVVHTDKSTGAETKMVIFETKHKILFRPFSTESEGKRVQFLTSNRTGKVWIARPGNTETSEAGVVTQMYQVFSPTRYDRISEQQLEDNYAKVTKEDAKKKWQEEIKGYEPYDTEKLNLLTGTLLRIWNRLPSGYNRVVRATETDTGEKHIGLVIDEEVLDATLRNLGAEESIDRLTTPQLVKAILERNATVRLANRWTIRKRTVAGENRLELSGDNLYGFRNELERYGVFSERINYDTRWFIPVGPKAVDIIEAITETRPVVEVTYLAQTAEDRLRDRATQQNRQAGQAGRVLTQPGPNAGDQIVGLGGPSVPVPADGKFHIQNAEMDAAIQEAKKGVPHDTWRDSFKEFMKVLWAKTNDFEFIPDTAKFSQIRTSLQRLGKQKGISADRQLRVLQGLVGDLSTPKYDLFEWKVMLTDFVREANAGRKVPFGFTEKQTQAELDRVDHLLDLNPDIQERWELRQAYWQEMKTRYVEAMDAIGFDVKHKITKQDYFRHQVLAYMQEQASSAVISGKRVMTPTGRGFLKRRAGTTLPINANYLQAEFEVLAQMDYDIALAQVVRLLDHEYNQQPALKKLAKQLNDKALRAMIAKEQVGSPDGKSVTEKQLKGFKQKIGYHMRALREDLGIGEGEQISLPQIARLAQDFEAEGNSHARGVLKWISKRRQWMKGKLGDKFVTWEQIIPPDMMAWQPREGNVFYMADTIPHQLAQQLQEGMLEQVGIVKEQLRQVLAMGGPREQFVLPREIVDQLSSMEKAQSSVVSQAWGTMLKYWKVGKLIGPHSVIKYNMRNLTGDSDGLFAGNPRAFRKAPQAMKELWPLFFSDAAHTGELKEWFNRGGFASTLQVQEMGDLNELKLFRVSLEREWKGGLGKVPLKIWNKYWKSMRLATDYRETILRYAAYLDYVERMQGTPDGNPVNFGASIPETVMALPDIRDRAWKLSNELLGAYDRISVTGQALRRYWIPFWSWKEVNFTRYKQLTKNAFKDQHTVKALTRLGLVGAKKGAMGTAKFLAPIPLGFSPKAVFGFALRASFLYAMLAIWNNLFHPEEEKDLKGKIKESPHIIFGRDEEGRVWYFYGVGALGDLLSWVGGNTLLAHVQDFMHDRMTLPEMLSEMAKAPVNVIAQGLSPFVKLMPELIEGRRWFPDVFERRPIRDRIQHVVDSLTPFGLEWRMASGTPMDPGLSAKGLGRQFAYVEDPGWAAYANWNDIEDRWRVRFGKPGFIGYTRTAKSEALALWRYALILKDEKAAARYKAQYEKLGGNLKHMKSSLYNLVPMKGFKVEEREKVLKSLDAHQREILKKAERFWMNQMLRPLPPSQRAIVIGKARANGWLSRESYPPPLPAP